MSALAHVAGVSMGGPTCYQGQTVDKPLLGPHNVLWSGRQIQRMHRIMYVAAGLCTVILTGLASWLHVWTFGS